MDDDLRQRLEVIEKKTLSLNILVSQYSEVIKEHRRRRKKTQQEGPNKVGVQNSATTEDRKNLRKLDEEDEAKRRGIGSYTAGMIPNGSQANNTAPPTSNGTTQETSKTKDFLKSYPGLSLFLF